MSSADLSPPDLSSPPVTGFAELLDEQDPPSTADNIAIHIVPPQEGALEVDVESEAGTRTGPLCTGFLLESEGTTTNEKNLLEEPARPAPAEGSLPEVGMPAPGSPERKPVPVEHLQGFKTPKAACRFDPDKPPNSDGTTATLTPDPNSPGLNPWSPGSPDDWKFLSPGLGPSSQKRVSFDPNNFPVVPPLPGRGSSQDEHQGSDLPLVEAGGSSQLYGGSSPQLPRQGQHGQQGRGSHPKEMVEFPLELRAGEQQHLPSTLPGGQLRASSSSSSSPSAGAGAASSAAPRGGGGSSSTAESLHQVLRDFSGDVPEMEDLPPAAVPGSFYTFDPREEFFLSSAPSADESGDREAEEQVEARISQEDPAMISAGLREELKGRPFYNQWLGHASGTTTNTSTLQRAPATVANRRPPRAPVLPGIAEDDRETSPSPRTTAESIQGRAFEEQEPAEGTADSAPLGTATVGAQLLWATADSPAAATAFSDHAGEHSPLGNDVSVSWQPPAGGFAAVAAGLQHSSASGSRWSSLTSALTPPPEVPPDAIRAGIEVGLFEPTASTAGLAVQGESTTINISPGRDGSENASVTPFRSPPPTFNPGSSGQPPTIRGDVPPQVLEQEPLVQEGKVGPRSSLAGYQKSGELHDQVGREQGEPQPEQQLHVHHQVHQHVDVEQVPPTLHEQVPPPSRGVEESKEHREEGGFLQRLQQDPTSKNFYATSTSVAGESAILNKSSNLIVKLEPKTSRIEVEGAPAQKELLHQVDQDHFSQPQSPPPSSSKLRQDSVTAGAASPSTSWAPAPPTSSLVPTQGSGAQSSTAQSSTAPSSTATGEISSGVAPATSIAVPLRGRSPSPQVRTPAASTAAPMSPPPTPRDIFSPPPSALPGSRPRQVPAFNLDEGSSSSFFFASQEQGGGQQEQGGERHVLPPQAQAQVVGGASPSGGSRRRLRDSGTGASGSGGSASGSASGSSSGYASSSGYGSSSGSAPQKTPIPQHHSSFGPDNLPSFAALSAAADAAKPPFPVPQNKLFDEKENKRFEDDYKTRFNKPGPAAPALNVSVIEEGLKSLLATGKLPAPSPKSESPTSPEPEGDFIF
ncbi:unnamed protein product [Amoebophrya sp. A25]|nr:unnamed protein product [Amoebophrya sp. A25]|eukprot:GSA25T00027064001.1